MEAERIARPLLQYAPDHLQLLTLLASTAQNRGDLDQATAYWIRIVQVPGATATHWNSLGLCHVTAGRVREASQAFEEACRLEPQFADSFNNLGLTMQDLGEREAAGRYLEQAIRVNPRFTAAYCNLGHHYRRQCRYDQANACFNKALESDPYSADAANGLGMVLHEQGDVSRASHYYREALRVRPTYSDASNNLATALKEEGKLDAAIAQYRETLALVPHHPYTIYNLSQFAAEGRFKFDPKELAHLKQVIASGQGNRAGTEPALLRDRRRPRRRSLARRGLHLLPQGERASQAGDPARAGYDAAKHRELVDRIIRIFDGDYFRDTRGWGTPSETPIFIVGMPRTGSTLVEQILATDPKVFAAGELGEMPRMMHRLCRERGEPDLYHTHRPFPSAESTQEFTRNYLAFLDSISRRAPRVTIKTLENVLHLGTIATMMPGARVIHCVRDPLDVCVSCYFQNFESLDFSWDLNDIASYWKDHERLTAHWQKKLPLRIQEVRYEELIRNPDKVTKELFAFCGLEWDAKCLHFFENRVAVRTASTVQVRKPLSTKPIGRWQRYRSHIGPLLDGAGLPAVGANRGGGRHPVADDDAASARLRGSGLAPGDPRGGSCLSLPSARSGAERTLQSSRTERLTSSRHMLGRKAGRRQASSLPHDDLTATARILGRRPRDLPGTLRIVASTIGRLVLLERTADVVLAVEHDPAPLVPNPFQIRGHPRELAADRRPALDRRLRQRLAAERLAEQRIVRGNLLQLHARQQVRDELAERAVEFLLAAAGIGEQQAARLQAEAQVLQVVPGDLELRSAMHVDELEVDDARIADRPLLRLEDDVEASHVVQVLHQVPHRPRRRVPVAAVTQLGHLERPRGITGGSGRSRWTATSVRRSCGSCMPVA